VTKRKLKFWVTSWVAIIALMIWIPGRLRFVIVDVDLGFQVILRAFAGTYVWNTSHTGPS